MSTQTKANLRDVLIGAAVVLLVISPGLFSSSAHGLDGPNHIWAMWMQGLAIAHTGHPTLYLSAGGMGLDQTVGLMEPWYGLYGGTLYAIVGAFSVLIGPQQAVTAYVISTAVFAGMAYRGVWFLARQFGVTPILSHLPAFIFLTSPYYVTDLYARGVWPEWTAFSMLPFALAYGLKLMRDPWRARTVAAFLIGVVLLTGSHNISLLWTIVFVAIFGTAAWLALGRDRLAVRRITPVIGLTALAVAVNAWFLAINLFHSRDVKIYWDAFYWDGTHSFNHLSNVITPFRTMPKDSGTADLIVTAPILALVVAFGLWFYGRRSGAEAPQSLRRVWWVLIASFLFATFLMIMPAGLWEFIGRPFTLTQFPYRLAAWGTASIVFALALALRLAGRPSPKARPFLAGAIGLLVAITLVQAGLQLFNPTPGGWNSRDRHEAVYGRGNEQVPEWWYDQGAYRDHTLPVVSVNQPEIRKIDLPIPPSGVTRVSSLVVLPDGNDPILTNIGAGPWIAKVTGEGFHVAGRTADGWIAIARNTDFTGRQVQITVTGDSGKLGRIGAIISILALFGIAVLLTILTDRRRREGKRLGGAATDAADPDAPTEPEGNSPSAGVAGYAGGW